MTDRYVSSRLIQKNIRFKVQIGDYSKYVSKGYYTSPEFGNDECKWSLLVHVYDGADHENFIDVRLQKHDCVTGEQFVNVKTSIVNCFGFSVLKNEKKMWLVDNARILAVAKADLKGYYGLKKKLYLPHDTLTLQCDLVVYENSVSAYENKEGFFRNINRSILDQFYEKSAFFRNRNNFSEYFAHSRLAKKAYDFFDRQITDFSFRAYEGRIVTPEYQSDHLGGKWSLVVCSTPEDNLAEYLDIRVMRQESYEHQLVKVRLSIIDCSDNVLLSKEKDIFFTSSREVQLLTLNEKSISSWFGVIKKDLIPGDTLTLHCEMTLYEQVDDSFSKKEEYEKSVKISGYSMAPVELLLYLVVICFILPVSLHIFYLICYAIISFLWYTVLDIYEIAKMFVFSVIAIAFFFIYIKNCAENIMHEKKIRENKKKKAEERKRMMLDQFYEKGAYNCQKNYIYYYKIPKNSYYVRNGFYYSTKPKYSNQKYISY